jgi:molybdopterin-guanine dinucleotide biosynthesis protein B
MNLWVYAKMKHMLSMIAVVGTHHSGKTTTIEYLISSLTKEGYSVGSIKHIHHEFSIDKEGTNTWRHMQAGSKITVAIAPHEIAIIKKTDSGLNSFDEIIHLLSNEKLDFIFLEGFLELINKRDDVLRIVSAKDPQDLEETLKKITLPILAITGLVAKEKIENKELSVPVINLPSEIDRLLKLIKQHSLNQNLKTS